MNVRSFAVAAGAGLVIAGAATFVLPGSVAAEQTAIPAGNLVTNPGGEFPFGGDFTTRNVTPNGWKMGENDDGKGIQVVLYGPDPRLADKAVATAIGGGRNYFVGGYPSRVSTAVQTVSVSRAAREIDAGGVKACLSAYLGGTKSSPSTARVELQFLGDNESALGQSRIGPVTQGQRLDATALLRRATESAVPKKTRQLRVVIRADSGGGPSNYGAADNVSVALTKGSCEPVLAVKCTKKTLVATVTPSSIAKTARVKLAVKGGKGTKQVDAARAPYSGRFTMDGLTGRLTVTANVTQKGSGPIVLTKKSRHC
jgi:hypothetical protein